MSSAKAIVSRKQEFLPTVMVPIANIIVDERYHRPLSRTMVQRIFDHLNAPVIVLTCAERPDGKVALLDGRRRLEALKLAGYTVVPCTVAPAMTFAEECRSWLKLNDHVRLRMTPKSTILAHAVEILNRSALLKAEMIGLSEDQKAIIAARALFIVNGNKPKKNGKRRSELKG